MNSIELKEQLAQVIETIKGVEDRWIELSELC